MFTRTWSLLIIGLVDKTMARIIDQEILQFSELDWVFLDIPTGKITANNYRSEPNTSFDYENDGRA